MKTFRILVVDDEPRLSSLLKKMLESNGDYEVKEENRPQHALSAALEFKPDLILLDVVMPGKDGGEVANEIRANHQLHDTPILFLTALISKSDTDSKTITRGAYEYMAKPVDPVLLNQRLEQILDPHKTCGV